MMSCIPYFFDFKQKPAYFFRAMILAILYLTFSPIVFAQNSQDISIEGSFVADSTLRVGKLMPFSVRVSHPFDREVVFADSTFDFSPFEWKKTDVFATITDKEGISVDSAVYWLRTFELDTLQEVKIPVYLIDQQSGDTTTYFTSISEKTMRFVLSKEQLEEMLSKDSLTMYQDTDFVKIPLQTNYPLYIVILIVLAALVILFFIIFGERIRRSYRLKRLKTQHQKFIAEYANQLKLAEKPEVTDHALGLWKKYMEKLKNEPFSSYTSSEIRRITEDETLGSYLKTIDRAIYGGQIDDSTQEALKSLESYAVQTFEKRLQQLKKEQEKIKSLEKETNKK